MTNHQSKSTHLADETDVKPDVVSYVPNIEIKVNQIKLK